MTHKLPEKLSDDVLFAFIEKKILDDDYIFVNHAKQRLIEREILDIEVLDILEDKPTRKRKRNKKKDSFHMKHLSWNYCIEGKNIDGEKIRIIITFNQNFLLIITVIKL